ncbi:MAG: hypothetical protein HOJ65_11880, partial [Verrucomicrobia bacterium]|nr:hypothetical protein [Verrucomicrobiota bacterium]
MAYSDHLLSGWLPAGKKDLTTWPPGGTFSLKVMKKWTTLLSCIATGFIFAGCGGEELATSAATDSNVIAYPLETCLVADSKLGSMGKPHAFVHEGREIKFCCEGCDDDFKADTAKYIKKF